MTTTSKSAQAMTDREVNDETLEPLWDELRYSTDQRGKFTEIINRLLAAQPSQAQAAEAVPKLTVWYGSMPESNGKTNWTAVLHKGDFASGMTIDRSEYPDRVRYEADRVRWLIGELTDEPWILDYDADKHSGYTPPASPVASEREGLTKEQRDAIEWAAGRAHVEALGKPIDGTEGRRWRALSDLFRATRTGSDK